MSIVELSTIAVIFYNPYGGILWFLLMDDKNEEKIEKNNKKPREFRGVSLTKTYRPQGIKLR